MEAGRDHAPGAYRRAAGGSGPAFAEGRRAVCAPVCDPAALEQLSEEMFLAQLQEEKQGWACYLHSTKDQVDGMVSVDHRTGRIEHLFVTQAARGKGLGCKMLDFARKSCRNIRIRCCRCWTAIPGPWRFTAGWAGSAAAWLRASAPGPGTGSAACLQVWCRCATRDCRRGVIQGAFCGRKWRPHKRIPWEQQSPEGGDTPLSRKIVENFVFTSQHWGIILLSLYKS